MTDATRVECRSLVNRPGRYFAWLGSSLGLWGMLTALLPVRSWGERYAALWLTLGAGLALVGLITLSLLTARVRADSYGVHSRLLLRSRAVRWSEIADFRVRVRRYRGTDVRRLTLVRREGRALLLPLPQTSKAADPGFDAEVAALRALHLRYGRPESEHLPVVSFRTAGRGLRWPVALGVLILGCAGVFAAIVPDASAQERAWEAAVPCPAGTSADRPRDCLTVLPAVISRTEAHRPKRNSWLYFEGGRPLRRVDVSYEAAEAFQAGDRVDVTLWRGAVWEVDGERYDWHEHMPGSGDAAMIAAGLALGAGYPAALVLVRRRGRRLADDEVLPSALPFAWALAGTAAWLLPLCHRHPTTLLSSREAWVWAAAGCLLSLGLFAWAWRATRVRGVTAPDVSRVPPVGGEVFLAARFLEDTAYNPHGFGTHIVLGGGPPAVVPHSGPGRFAAKRIPGERLTLREVRRPRGGDGEAVRRSWHVADLDDEGRPVRLAAAPGDLTRILVELDLAPVAAGGGGRR
ncbi:PH domain-containing protein [Streptomyces sp. NPDC051940]|uniref:PH domain-containing protein n=1 Tax=Streptomyces sp. NPDC051940 TaxID=3155675 RepID=UPI00342D0513